MESRERPKYSFEEQRVCANCVSWKLKLLYEGISQAGLFSMLQLTLIQVPGEKVKSLLNFESFICKFIDYQVIYKYLDGE